MDLREHSRLIVLVGAIVGLTACGGPAPADEEGMEEPVSIEELLGRWDVTVEGPEQSYPSWFELNQEGDELSGRFVGRVGSVRPMEQLDIEVDAEDSEIYFSLPTQYESHPEDMWFRGELVDGQLQGTTNSPEGDVLSWTAVPAPALERTGEPNWGESIDLLATEDLMELWRVRSEEAENLWTLDDGVLENSGQGTDLITRQEFMDFKLETEFRYPEGSNSGIFLRGRYEVQIQDDIGKDPGNRLIGGVYGFLTPTRNMAKPAGEWQTYEITLLGRNITVVLNGETIINNQEIPGITGGALDSSEGEPGPLMLQGDHGPVSFRNLVITPAQ